MKNRNHTSTLIRTNKLTIHNVRNYHKLGRHLNLHFFKKLKENVKLMQGTTGDYQEIDKDFHRIIAFSASNSVTEGMIDAIFNMYDKIMENADKKNQNKMKIIQQHKEIYRALEKKDPIEAYASMYRHLDHERNRIILTFKKKVVEPGKDLLEL